MMVLLVLGKAMTAAAGLVEGGLVGCSRGKGESCKCPRTTWTLIVLSRNLNVERQIRTPQTRAPQARALTSVVYEEGQRERC